MALRFLTRRAGRKATPLMLVWSWPEVVVAVLVMVLVRLGMAAG